MTIQLFDTLRRALKTCAKQTRFSRLRQLLANWFARRSGIHVRRLNDHMARDIGLTPAEIERNRLVLPSQSTDRPGI